jgi:integrase/recombinase XerD
MVLDPSGEIAPNIELYDVAAKMRSGRRVPLHNDLREALTQWREVSVSIQYVVVSERGGGLTPSSIANWFTTAYRSIGLAGCSSHSGRRTFITRAARLVHKAGGSLRDVQLLAGHRSIQTTQRYINGDTDAQRRLVALI